MNTSFQFLLQLCQTNSRKNTFHCSRLKQGYFTCFSQCKTSLVKCRCSKNECPMKITIQRQVKRKDTILIYRRVQTEVINLVKKTGAGKSLKNLKNKSSKNAISPILSSHLFKKQTKYKQNLQVLVKINLSIIKMEFL